MNKCDTCKHYPNFEDGCSNVTVDCSDCECNTCVYGGCADAYDNYEPREQ